MISTTSFILLLALIAFFIFWRNAMRAKETATTIASGWCTNHAFQLLDETVFLKKIKFKKNDEGRLKLFRLYQFEYTIENFDRHQTELALLGDQLFSIHHQKPEEKIISFHRITKTG